MTADVRAHLEQRMGDLRTLKRLDAVVEASRAAVLITVPRLIASHDAALSERGPEPRRTANRWFAPREVLVIVATLLAATAAALVLPSPRNGRPALGVDQAGVWVGVLAVTAAAIFALLERGRLRSFYLGAHTRSAPRLYFVLNVVWALVFVFIVANWAEQVRLSEATQPAAGLVLLGIAIVGLGTLALVARRRDRVALADPIVAARDEWGRTPGDTDPFEEWWAGLSRRLTPAERGAADRSYRAVLEVLEQNGVIRPRDARRLQRKRPAVVWRGDAA